jgi:hypothetical protein
MDLTIEQINKTEGILSLWSIECLSRGMMPMLVVIIEPKGKGEIADGQVFVSDEFSPRDVRRVLETALLNLPNDAGGISPAKN